MAIVGFKVATKTYEEDTLSTRPTFAVFFISVKKYVDLLTIDLITD